MRAFTVVGGLEDEVPGPREPFHPFRSPSNRKILRRFEARVGVGEDVFVGFHVHDTRAHPVLMIVHPVAWLDALPFRANRVIVADMEAKESLKMLEAVESGLGQVHLGEIRVEVFWRAIEIERLTSRDANVFRAEDVVAGQRFFAGSYLFFRAAVRHAVAEQHHDADERDRDAADNGRKPSELDPAEGDDRSDEDHAEPNLGPHVGALVFEVRFVERSGGDIGVDCAHGVAPFDRRVRLQVLTRRSGCDWRHRCLRSQRVRHRDRSRPMRYSSFRPNPVRGRSCRT